MYSITKSTKTTIGHDSSTKKAAEVYMNSTNMNKNFCT